ncbi:MAG: endolytic transglycosylase MltG [Bacteroidota bacterium]|jgi:UPF0755 protein
MKNKWWRISLFAILGLLILFSVVGYSQIFGSNTAFADSSKLLYIPSHFSHQQLKDRLSEQGIIQSSKSFDLVAKLKKFDQPKPGRYRIKAGMSNNEMINLLRSGNQEAITIRFDDLKNIYQLAGRLASTTELDSTTYIHYFTSDSVLTAYNCDLYTLPALFIGDSYEFLWTVKPNDVLQRMQTVKTIYWTADKKTKAAAMGLGENEVATLASIVKGETANMEEAPRIAGLYFNRLKMGMLLQSDPTVVFANNLFGINRVLHSDLQTNSPYNTYVNKGLPPGPISFADAKYLDAVLNYETHDYIYMCAQAGGTGKHNFSKTYQQHLQYAAEYQKYLNDRGTRR